MPSDSNKKRKLSADQVDEDSDDAAPKGSDVKETGQDEDKMQVNEDGDKFMQLSGKRRLTVRKFNGKVLVDVREYYTDKDGNDKPGKKGISLSMEQWQTLRDSSSIIDAAVADLQ